MALRDLSEFLFSPPIELPVRGKTYRFPGTVPGRVTLQLRLIQEQSVKAARARASGEAGDYDPSALADVDERYVRDMLFTLDGADVEKEMVDDGCTAAEIDHVMNTLIVWHTAGRETAEEAWESMAGPTQQPNRATRRAASSGTAKSTPSRASTSSTRPRKPAAKALPGGKS